MNIKSGLYREGKTKSWLHVASQPNALYLSLSLSLSLYIYIYMYIVSIFDIQFWCTNNIYSYLLPPFKIQLSFDVFHFIQGQLHYLIWSHNHMLFDLNYKFIDCDFKFFKKLKY